MPCQATVWGGIANADLKPGEPVGILGIGGLGSLAVQFAKAQGHPVVAIDNRPEGRALATELTLKADLVVNFDDPEAIEKVKSWTGKGGLPAVVVCTDKVEAIQWSGRILRSRGTIVEIGLPTDPIKFDTFDIIFQEKTIKGSLVASKSQVETMLEVIDRFGIRSRVTTVSLQEATNLTERYMDPHLKGRLVMKIAS
jgi:D-arabinose 1-dehydrogenase-like Zn-dependent alcohol dehydrogenase